MWGEKEGPAGRRPARLVPDFSSSGGLGSLWPPTWPCWCPTWPPSCVCVDGAARWRPGGGGGSPSSSTSKACSSWRCAWRGDQVVARLGPVFGAVAPGPGGAGRGGRPAGLLGAGLKWGLRPTPAARSLAHPWRIGLLRLRIGSDFMPAIALGTVVLFSRERNATARAAGGLMAVSAGRRVLPALRFAPGTSSKCRRCWPLRAPVAQRSRSSETRKRLAPVLAGLLLLLPVVRFGPALRRPGGRPDKGPPAPLGGCRTGIRRPRRGPPAESARGRAIPSWCGLPGDLRVHPHARRFPVHGLSAVHRRFGRAPFRRFPANCAGGRTPIASS